MTETKYDLTDFDGNQLPPDDAAALAALLDRVQAPPAEGWRPTPGDIVLGTVIDIDYGSSEFGDDYPLITILRPTGDTTAVHCFHTVLRQRMNTLIEKGKVHEGAKIAVRYIGVDPNAEVKKGRNAPELYSVAVQS